LKVIDLRWNEIGEVGAQAIFPALAFNAHLRALPLEDNRISSSTLLQFADLLRNPSRGTLPLAAPKQQERVIPESYYPISEGDYPSMDAQLKTAQLRGKIES
jgi:Leucine Rich repeat